MMILMHVIRPKLERRFFHHSGRLSIPCEHFSEIHAKYYQDWGTLISHYAQCFDMNAMWGKASLLLSERRYSEASASLIGRIYTRDGSPPGRIWTKKTVRPIVRLCVNTGEKTDHPSRRTFCVFRLLRRTSSVVRVWQWILDMAASQKLMLATENLGFLVFATSVIRYQITLVPDYFSCWIRVLVIRYHVYFFQ